LSRLILLFILSVLMIGISLPSCFFSAVITGHVILHSWMLSCNKNKENIKN
jgi:hypothetical protein